MKRATGLKSSIPFPSVYGIYTVEHILPENGISGITQIPFKDADS